MVLSQVLKDALAVPGASLALWLEVEGLDGAWGTSSDLGAAAFLHRAERYRRTAAKPVLVRQPSGVQQEARPLDGDSTIGSLTAELADDGSGDVLALAANTARTDDWLVTQVEKEWAPSTAYAVGDLVRPRASSTATGNRHWFRCATDGTSQASEPAWPTSGTVADGASLAWSTQGPQDLPADLEDARIPYAGSASATTYPTTGGVVYLGRETFRYSSRSVAPNGGGFFDGCKRGWFELDGLAQPYAHTAGDVVSPYPRFIATRRARLYLAPGPVTNLLQRSQEFHAAAWNKVNATVTADIWTAPDGTTTGDTVTDTAANAEHYFYESFPVEIGRQLAASLFLRAGTISKCRVRTGAAVGAGLAVDVDLVAETATVASGSGTAQLRKVGPGTFRLECSTTASASSTVLQVYLATGAFVFSYAGGTGTLQVWGAQVRYGDVAGRYVASTGGPATAAVDTGAAVVRYAGVVRRPTMPRGLTGVGLEVESSEVELRVTAMSNRRSFKLRAGIEGPDFVDQAGVAAGTNFATYDKPDEQSPLHTTTYLQMNAGAMDFAGAPIRDDEAGHVRTWRIGDEYVQGMLDMPDARLDVGERVVVPGVILAAPMGRGYFSSRIVQHDPGDEVIEVLPLGAPPRFEEFFSDGVWRTKVDFKHDGVAATATIGTPAAGTGSRFPSAAVLATAVENALYAAWPATGTNYWDVSFDSAGRALIGYVDPTAHVVEFLWRTGTNNGIDVSARLLLGFAERDVRIDTPGDYARSGEPASCFHFSEEPDHPLNVVLRLLASKGDGSNGSYDVLPRGFGAGVDQSRIDVAGIEALRDSWMPEAQHFEVLVEPFVLKKKVAEILRSCGCYLASVLGDKLTVRRMNPPVPGAAQRTIDAAVVLEPADWEMDPARAVGRVLYYCDPDPAHSSTEVGPWRQRYTSELQGPGVEVQEYYAGLFKTVEVEARGQWTGNNLVAGGRFGPNLGTGAAEAARRVFELVRDRAARPVPGIRLSCGYDTLDIEVGDVVSVTLAQVPDASAGTRGLSVAACEVAAKTIDEARGTVELLLIQTAYGARMRLLAPTGVVATTQTSTTIALGAAYAPPGTASEASQFIAGDAVEVFDPTLKTSRGTGVVQSVGATSIVVGSAIAQTAGDVVLLRPFTTQPAARQARSAFRADASPVALLGGGPAHVYAS